MRVVESINLNFDLATLDPWLSLEALSKASGLSVRTLRAALSGPQHPLPHFRLKEPHVIVTRAGKRRIATGKITVRWSEFQKWYEAYRYTPNLDRLVNEVVQEISG